MTRHKWVALAGIVLFAFSLRTAVASLSPLFSYIEEDFSVSPTAIGILGAIPLICYAALGVVTPALERRAGLGRLALVALLITTIGLIWRALAGDALTLIGATIVTFAGLGISNILTPALVKKYFPKDIGVMTALYSTLMSTATFLPAAIAVPVAEATGWRVSLSMWALFALLAMIPWIMMIIHERGDADQVSAEVPNQNIFRRLWRLPLTWALTAGFAMSASFGYTGFAWLPTILLDTANVDASTAGGLLAMFAFMTIPMSMLVPLLMTRFQATRILFGCAFGLGALGIVGLLIAPGAAPWLWTALLGAAPPTLFGTILVLLVLRTRTHHTAVALSSFVQSVGYGIAAGLPILCGLLYNVTGGWTAALVVLLILLFCTFPAGYFAARKTTVEEQWEARHGTW